MRRFLKWLFSWLLIFSLFLIPASLCDRLPDGGATVKKILLITAGVIDAIAMLCCLINEARGNRPLALQRGIDGVLMAAAGLVFHPILTVKSQVLAIRRAKGLKKLGKILMPLLGLAVIAYVITVAVYLIIAILAGIFAIGMIGGSAEDQAAQEYKRRYGYVPSSETVRKWAGL